MHTLWGDQCVFRTVQHDGQRGQVRCAIHAYAAQSGVSYLDVKPTDCWFWPLALIPLYTGQFFLTVHTEETRHFTEESESYAKEAVFDRTHSRRALHLREFSQRIDVCVLVRSGSTPWKGVHFDTKVMRIIQETKSEDRPRLQRHHTGLAAAGPP